MPVGGGPWLASNSMRLTACFLVALVGAPVSASPWSQWRGDPTRSGVAGPLHINAPGIRWVRLTGGTALDVAAHDLDGDGALDVLTVEGGRLVARKASGQVLWDSPGILARAVLDVRDMDGDGVREVVVDATSRAVLLDAETGAVVWTSAATLPIENIASFLVADVLGSPEPELIIADKAGNAAKPLLTGAAFVFSFGAGTDGLGAGTPTAVTQGGTRDYESGRAIAVADLDGDGALEIIAPGAARLYAYDPPTGSLKWSTEALPGTGTENLSWSSVQVTDADGDGRQEVLVLTSSTFISTPSRRVAMAALDDGALRWRYTFAAPGPGLTGHQWPARAVADLDGDGAAELVTSFWSEGNGWTTHVRDAATGTAMTTLAGERAVTVLPGQPGAPAELVTEPTAFLAPGPFGPRRVWRYGAGATLTHEWTRAQVATPTATFSGAPEVVVTRDTDGDDWGDVVEIVRRGTGEVVRTAAAGGVLLRVQTASAGGAARAMLLHASGRLAVLGADFTLLNDQNGDGLADLRFEGHYLQRVAVLAGPGGPLLLSPEAGGQLAALDPLLGTPFAEPPVHLALSANMPQVPVALDAPGGPRVMRLHQDQWRRQIVSAISADGSVAWSTSLGGAGGTLLLRGDPLALDLDADGSDELVLCVQDTALGAVHQVVAIDGATGAVRWASSGIDTPGGSVGNLAARGGQILLTANKQLVVLDGASGASFASVTLPGTHYRGTPIVTNLDGDPALEVLIAGTTAGAVALDDNLAVLWTVDLGQASLGSGAVASGPPGRVALLSRAKSPRVDLVAASSGKPLGAWSLAAGMAWAPGKEPVGATSQVQEILPATDLLGDGGDGFLVTSSDGFVYALRSDGGLAWALEVGGALATPAIVDVDGDGTAELAIPVTSGRLALIDDTPVGAPEWVVESASPGGSIDLDVQEDPTALTVSWAAVSGASSYAVRLTSQFGTVIAEQLDTAGGATWTFQDLSLQPAVWYSASVRALETGMVAGPMTVSDGVTITDLSAPSVTEVSASPSVLSPDLAEVAPSTTLSATMRDVTRLVWWALTIEDGDGQPARSWGGPLSTRTFTVNQAWDGLDDAGEMVTEGVWTARFTAFDQAGHAAEATATVVVLRAEGETSEDTGRRAPERGHPCAHIKPGKAKGPKGKGAERSAHASKKAACLAKEAKRKATRSEEARKREKDANDKAEKDAKDKGAAGPCEASSAKEPPGKAISAAAPGKRK